MTFSKKEKKKYWRELYCKSNLPPSETPWLKSGPTLALVYSLPLSYMSWKLHIAHDNSYILLIVLLLTAYQTLVMGQTVSFVGSTNTLFQLNYYYYYY